MEEQEPVVISPRIMHWKALNLRKERLGWRVAAHLKAKENT